LIVRLADALIPQRDQRVVQELTGLARQLGAYDVVYRARTAHGFTEWNARGPRVVLGWADAEGRRRSLLAHECGHLLFDPLLKPESLEQIPESERDRWANAAAGLLECQPDALRKLFSAVQLEDLCDDFAYELVFPDRLAARLAPAIDSIEVLSDCRSRMHVTMSVAVLKLNRFRAAEGYPEIGVLQARRSAGDYWMAASSCGFPASWRGRVVMTRESSRALDRMAQGENRRTNIGINNGVETMHVRAEVQKYREHVTVMIETGDVLSGAARIDR
jgi:Zn-dependent peptidase ImmA (M78 family)